jgi:hypothetical protein
MSRARGVVKAAQEPPEAVETERLEAKILDIRQVEGKWGEQLEFNLELAGGYRLKSWIRYYESPSEKTELGKLLLTIMRLQNKDIQDVQEGLDWLTHYGWIYIECTGHRTFNGKSYPKFKVITGTLPDHTKRQTGLT